MNNQQQKIKYLIALFVLAFSALQTNAQIYMDLITEKSCGCLENISDNAESESLKLKLGICMLEAAEPYKEQLKAEFGIDLNKNDDSGEKLGRIIGLKMAVTCPAELMKLAGKSGMTGMEEKTVRGLITRIDKEQFVAFSLKDDNGRITKYYWLTFIESAADLTSKYTSYNNKKVEITFRNQDFFDPRIDEYRSFSVILKMDVLE